MMAILSSLLAGLKSEEPEPWAMSLESKEDFDAFQKSLVSQLEKHTKSPHLVPFLEELLREISIGCEFSLESFSYVFTLEYPKFQLIHFKNVSDPPMAS